jgi:hypothetical protein
MRGKRRSYSCNNDANGDASSIVFHTAPTRSNAAASVAVGFSTNEDTPIVGVDERTGTM